MFRELGTKLDNTIQDVSEFATKIYGRNYFHRKKNFNSGIAIIEREGKQLDTRLFASFIETNYKIGWLSNKQKECLLEKMRKLEEEK